MIVLASIAFAFEAGVSDLAEARAGFNPEHAGLFAAGGESIDLFTGAVNLSVTDVCIPGAFGLPMCMTRTYSSKVVTESLARIDESWAGLGWTVLIGGRIQFDTFAPEVVRIQLPGGPEQLAYWVDPGDLLYREAADANAFPHQVSSDSSLYVTTDFTFVYRDGSTYYALQRGGVLHTFDIATGGQADGWIYAHRLENPWGDALDIDFEPCAYTTAGGAIDDVTDAYGRRLEFGVDSDCELSSVSFENTSGAESSFAYSVLDHLLVRATTPTGESTAYAYEATYDELDTIRWPTGGTTSYTFETVQVVYDMDPTTAITTKDIRVLVEKTADDGSDASSWAFSYESPAWSTSENDDGDTVDLSSAYRTTTVQTPSGDYIRHSYYSWCYGYTTDEEGDVINGLYCPRRALGRPIWTAWYESDPDSGGTPLKWVYSDFGDSGSSDGINDVEVAATAYDDPYAITGSSAPAAVVPRAVYTGFDSDPMSSAYAMATVYGEVSGGDYDGYAQPLSVATAGYAPYWDTDTSTQYYFGATVREYAWESEPALDGWGLTDRVAVDQSGYPDGVGGLSSTWSETTSSWSTDAATIGWPESGYTAATGAYDLDADGVEDPGEFNASDAVSVTIAYAVDRAAGLRTVTTDYGGLRTQETEEELGTVVSAGWYDDQTSPELVVFETATVNDATGLVTAVTSADGQTTALGYDDALRLLSVTPPVGPASAYTYALTATTPTITLALGGASTSWSYDGLGRLVRTATSNGDHATAYLDVAYDSEGRTASTYAPHDGTRGAYTSIGYDAAGRVSSTSRTDGSTTYTTSTAFAFPVVASTNALGVTTRLTQDGQGAAWETDTPLGANVQWRPQDSTYNLQSAKVIDSSGTAQVEQYRFLDQSGSPWLLSDPQSNRRWFTRDATGALACESDDNGDAVATAYDWAGRPAATDLGTSCTVSSSPAYVYHYDGEVPAAAAGWDAGFAAGMLSGVDDGDGYTTFAYDEAGRPTAMERGWDDGVVTDLAYTWTADGEVASVSIDSEWTLHYTYGAGHRVEGIEVEGPRRTTPVLLAASYHPDGSVATRELGNGVLVTRELDSHGRTGSITTAGTTDDDTWAYTWDGNHNLLVRDEGDGPANYTYDELDRLTEVSYIDDGARESFTYDDLGNLAAVSGTYANGSTTYTHNRNDDPSWDYDSVGNLVSDGAVEYAYDARGRMTSSNSADGTLAITQSFDAEGRRLTRSIIKQVAVRARVVLQIHETRYLYDADGKLLATLEGDGRKRPRIANVYVHAGPEALAVVETHRAGRTYWLLRDTTGSVRKVADKDGVVGAWSDWTAYGLERDDFGTMPGSTEHAWAGHGGDDPNGVRDFGARSFLSDHSRFATPDRAVLGSPGNPASFNRYAYVEGNPAKYVDPSGEVIETAWDIANVAMDLASLSVNISAGNWGGAALDTVGLIVDGAATVVPGAPGGAGTAIKLARAADKGSEILKAADAAKDVVKTADLAKASALHRPYVRVGTRAKVEAAAPRNALGRPLDPNTGAPIVGKPDLGHKTGREFRREKAGAEQAGISQKKFNDQMNDPDIYQLENPASNRSHRYEQK